MTAPFEPWEVAARVAMGDRGIDHDAADNLIDAARAHWEQSGGDPWAEIGSPDAFATSAASERPVSERAARDRDGMTPGDHLSGAVFTLAVVTVPVALLAAATRGTLSFVMTPAGLAGSALFALCWVVVLGGPGTLRAAGRPRTAPWLYAAGAVLVAITAAAFTLLPRTPLGRMPVLGIVAVAAVAAWSTTRTGKARPATGGRSSTVDPGNAERWFTSLSGLLVGRFDVAPERAGELVDEARHHLASSGGSPVQEFGPVDEYAVHLAEEEGTRHGPWWRAHGTAVRRDGRHRVRRPSQPGLLDRRTPVDGSPGGRAALAGAYISVGLARRWVRGRRLHSGRVGTP